MPEASRDRSSGTFGNKMTYLDFKAVIQGELTKRRPAGATWNELRMGLDLPYKRPCPEWTKRLETDIGLRRVKMSSRAFVWRLP